MTGLVRRATLFTAVGLMAAVAAYAGVPSAATSTLGTGIMLGGRVASNVDALVQKTMTVRDAANNPVPNSVVVINFSTCTASDIRLCSVQSFAGMFVNCAAKTVSAVTNASGVATFRIIGGANNPGLNPAGVGVGCASVTADGVSLGSLTVGAPDENNTGGVTVLDTAAFFDDRFGAYRGRSDMDGTGPPLGVLDTAIFFGVRLGGGWTTSCSSTNC